jgi:hypothetical protein
MLRKPSRGPPQVGGVAAHGGAREKVLFVPASRGVELFEEIDGRRAKDETPGSEVAAFDAVQSDVSTA